MRALSLAELQTPLAATISGERTDFIGVSTDSRSVHSGDLFVALRGDSFNGHHYLADVERRGAVALLVSEANDNGLPQLRVTDTRRGLGLLGAFNRALYGGPLVAITGSSGKTTVKNMVHAVLATQGETLATKGNFNNEIGVPLTLLRLQPGVEYAVVEMGAARLGDIAWLCQLAKPTVTLLLNAMPAHLEGFGTVEDVANAKGEIFDNLGSTDCAVINADQPWARQWRKRAGAAIVLDFGMEQPAAISARDIQLRGMAGVSFTATTPAGDIAIKLSLPGKHNVANALAAVAVGLACNASLVGIRDGLESVQPVAGRVRALRSPEGATVIDDCYNANPGSVRAAIDMLAAESGRRTLILGAMRELGANSVALHREIGAYARQSGVDQLWGVGEELQACVDAFGTGGEYFADRAAVLANLSGQFKSEDTVLIKGSRSAGMEEVLEAFLNNPAHGRAN